MMNRTMSAEDAQEFARISGDENCLHSDSEMWRDYGIPALIPGMQTLCTALAGISSDELVKLNYVRANFQRMILVGSEVDFKNERIKRGFWKGILAKFFEENSSAQDIRISAYVNGIDTLAGSKDEPSLATRVELLEKPSFNEGDFPLQVLIDADDVRRFGALTNLPQQTILPLYALASSSHSIAHRIMNPLSVPSWLELNNSLVAPPDKRKIPAYESLEAYFPNGFGPTNLKDQITLRSAIRKEGNVYVIDTICQSGDERIYGVRANLKQRAQGAIVKGISALLDNIEKQGNPGSLFETIQRRKRLMAGRYQETLTSAL